MALTKPFAENGDKKAIPQTTSDGSVSFDRGFGSFYALPPEEGGLFIDRAQFNQLMYDTTSAVISNQTSINTLNSKVADLESGVSTGVVNLTDNQTIAGTKTFSSPIIIPNGTANTHAVNLAQLNTKANQATTYNKTEVDDRIRNYSYPRAETYNKSQVDVFIDSLADSKANQATTYTKTEVNNLLNAKANSNAVVDLSGNQTIAGVKTFTSNITAPNITTLQNQMNGLISSDVYPLLTKNTSLDITVGSGGMFTNIIDGLIFLKQNISKNPNVIGKITLLSSFNDDLYLKGYPFKILIDCNGFQLANNLFLEKCNITFNSLTLNGQLNVLISTVHVVNGAVINGNSQLSNFFGSSIVANSNSFVSISGDVLLRPPRTEAGIYSKASRVYLVNPSNWAQNQGQYFAYVMAGGIICADGGVNLQQIRVRKTNVAANTLTSSGIIFGNIWG